MRMIGRRTPVGACALTTSALLNTTNCKQYNSRSHLLRAERRVRLPCTFFFFHSMVFGSPVATALLDSVPSSFVACQVSKMP